LDIKNRHPVALELQNEIARRLDAVAAECDAIIVADQVSEPDCGVVTTAIRKRLGELGSRYPAKVILADSRERIGQFENVLVKPNQTECLRAEGVAATAADRAAIETAALRLAFRVRRPVYCTLGGQGALYADSDRVSRVPGYPVAGPIDIVGAGDSTTAGIVCALCAGAEPLEAAALGNLVASITIQQIGTTGTATPEQVLDRWREIDGK
jgi:sugar/nucleoside kinase (ribokinase family)